jgi:hypothetical protein
MRLFFPIESADFGGCSPFVLTVGKLMALVATTLKFANHRQRLLSLVERTEAARPPSHEFFQGINMVKKWILVRPSPL